MRITLRVKQAQHTPQRKLFCFLSLILLALVEAQFTVANISENDNREVEDCAVLGAAGSFTIPDAPTQVLSTQYVNSTDWLPGHCVVNGYIASQVQSDVERRPPVLRAEHFSA